MDAYLDIETTGLDPYSHYITVLGIYQDGGAGEQVTQLVGPDVTSNNLQRALNGVLTIYTYNGSGFDMPFIRHRLGINLPGQYHHRDLMFDCWHNRLYGGLKKVEIQLGICRQVVGVDGREAVRLWWQYIKGKDSDALQTLLKYNREDLVNLKVLRTKLAGGRCA
ncbi:MAG: ribonuclease H-like domain-containing protein [Chloroflexi bacterium]|nr:ribonuclease H-like domain-containing protein [Chloroflexota bacterium]